MACIWNIPKVWWVKEGFTILRSWVSDYLEVILICRLIVLVRNFIYLKLRNRFLLKLIKMLVYFGYLRLRFVCLIFLRILWFFYFFKYHLCFWILFCIINFLPWVTLIISKRSFMFSFLLCIFLLLLIKLVHKLHYQIHTSWTN